MLALRAAARSTSRFKPLPATHSERYLRVLQAARGPRSYQGLVESKFFKVSQEVRYAIATRQPVVALETTIYTHGFPYPENVQLASLLESVVRANGGVPATIGIVNGVARVGLSADELVELASTTRTKSALKVSRRDLGYICGLGTSGKPLHGGTTVSGTMVLAHLAGIRVFGTGGLGGVHRGGEVSMDVSADLTELGRTPVAVVSSGCKSFLDISRTLEYLETEGVCVGTFADGREGSVNFPAFYTRDSGVQSPKVIQNEAEAAAVIYAQSKLPVSSGILFANPVPLEHSFPKVEMDKIIEDAIRLADVKGFRGSDNTPFILAQIRKLSGGRSVDTNRALVENNVKRATRVAVELAKLEKLDRDNVDRHLPVIPVNATTANDYPTTPNRSEQTNRKIVNKSPNGRRSRVDVLVAGSLALDLSCDFAPLPGLKSKIAPVPQTSNPAIIGQSLGGVGHNVVLASHYAGASVLFCSVVADDLSGHAAIAALKAEGLDAEGVQVIPATAQVRSAQYVAVNDAQKDLVIAMADMGIMELSDEELNFDGFWEPLMQRTKPRWVVVDANWNPAVLAKWTSIARKHGARVAFEPVSSAKSRRLFGDDVRDIATIGQLDIVPNNTVNIASPNRLELVDMYLRAREAGLFESAGWWHIIDAMGLSSAGSRERLVAMTNARLVDDGVPQQSIQLLPFVPCIITKLGTGGVLLTQMLRPGDPRLTSDDSAPYILSRASGTSPLIGGVYLRLFPPEKVLSGGDIVSVNGAGDTLLGVVIAGLSSSDEQNGNYVEDFIPIAQRASIKTLQSAGGVSRDILTLRKSVLAHAYGETLGTD